MNYQEAENIRRANERMPQCARPDPPAPFFEGQCPACQSTVPNCAGPGAESALRRLGWVTASVGGVPQWFCTGACVAAFQRAAARNGQPVAVPLEPTTPPPEPKAQPLMVKTNRKSPPVAVEERVLKISCGRCSSRIDLDQRRAPGAEWQPAENRVIEFSGWVRDSLGRLYCGALCRGEAAAPPHPPVAAVTRIDDASYQATRAATRARAVAPPPSDVQRELAGREIPDKPAKRARSM